MSEKNYTTASATENLHLSLQEMAEALKRARGAPDYALDLGFGMVEIRLPDSICWREQPAREFPPGILVLPETWKRMQREVPQALSPFPLIGTPLFQVTPLECGRFLRALLQEIAEAEEKPCGFLSPEQQWVKAVFSECCTWRGPEDVQGRVIAWLSRVP